MITAVRIGGYRQPGAVRAGTVQLGTIGFVSDVNLIVAHI